MTQQQGFVRVVGDGDDQDHAVTRQSEQNADAAAFCAAEWPQLVRAMSLYVGDPHVAEEVAQEALLRACRQWTTVAQLDSPGGWTWRVATNLAALVLCHVLGLSAPETAERMGVSPDAVRSLTKRATATLRDQLGERTPLASREVHDA